MDWKLILEVVILLGGMAVNYGWFKAKMDDIMDDLKSIKSELKENGGKVGALEAAKLVQDQRYIDQERRTENLLKWMDTISQKQEETNGLILQLIQKK